MNAERGMRNAEQQGKDVKPRDLRERTKASFWLELLAEAGLTGSEDARRLRAEADQLVAITISSIRTARGPRINIPRSAFRVPR
ncbi:MAG TPA: hypothetical protein VKQ05_06250 [Gemmatimonadales bacterium]|nr:hypothetical protein [Gemmatimonadales bacterium]